MYIHILIMDNKIVDGKYTYDIDKITFFNNLKNKNKNSNNVLDQFKQDFHSFKYSMNQKQVNHSNEILEFILKYYNNYLEEILLLSSHYAINEIIKTLSHILWSEYHIIEHREYPYSISIQLNLLMKQVILSLTVNIFEVNKNSTLLINKIVNVSLIFNITNFTYLRIVLETVNDLSESIHEDNSMI